MNEVTCPCCGDEMDAVNVVCWTCYRLSDRLTPGTYRDPDNQASPYDTFTITAADVARVARYDAERTARLAEVRS